MFLSRKIGSGLAGPKAKPTRRFGSLEHRIGLGVFQYWSRYFSWFPPREIQAGSTDKVTEVSTLQVPIRLAKDLRGTAQQQKKVNCEDKWIRVLLIRYRRNGGPGK